MRSILIFSTWIAVFAAKGYKKNGRPQCCPKLIPNDMLGLNSQVELCIFIFREVEPRQVSPIFPTAPHALVLPNTRHIPPYGLKRHR